MATLYARIPDELHAMLRERAQASRRSIVQELIILLEEALKVSRGTGRG